MQTTVNTRFIPANKWNEAGHLYPADEGELRWLLRNREINGLTEAKAVIKVGRRLLINERAFLAWIESQVEAPGSNK